MYVYRNALIIRVLIMPQIVFLGLTLTGVIIPLLMADPEKMIRTDGTKVTTPRHPTWKVELYGLWITLRTDPMVILLFPMFFTSNWFYTWRKSTMHYQLMECADVYRIQRLQ